MSYPPARSAFPLELGEGDRLLCHDFPNIRRSSWCQLLPGQMPQHMPSPQGIPRPVLNLLLPSRQPSLNLEMNGRRQAGPESTSVKVQMWAHILGVQAWPGHGSWKITWGPNLRLCVFGQLILPLCARGFFICKLELRKHDNYFRGLLWGIN